ncbi:unnamed protein product [Rotaria magnacalcarata]|uniref:Phytanoyl-CoA dioxygenase n=1 Tax=Rotaria magnacalcarata TaxID=392030 RepID=A0A819Y377_9BILA|nr:unnamed protein product [Rotaria magnacalcarata]CAF2028537.1 unnamed protein product [Rotaria magnacalcarata]CAF2045916.1 unnamed protein product [Rotaria magnacalcarata]CAF2140991.1 unnamed protein product [Rotaria magnacalcarata]CAF3881069.1 unnamed protein product [Rotaria magnacalcarata]
MVTLPERPAITNEAPISDDVLDLSTISEPIGELFGSLSNNGDSYTPYLLTTEQIEFYKTNGYLNQIRVLTDEQCDRLLEEYKRFLLWNKKDLSQANALNDAHRLDLPGRHLLHEYHSNQTGDPDNVLTHMLGHWRVTPLFHDLIFLPNVTVPTSQLIAACHTSDKKFVPVQFWHDQLFAKPPFHGGPVAWHQDYSYWTRTEPMQHLTVHIALDDQTEENGTLQFVPGSHQWHRERDGKQVPLPVTDFDFKDMDSIKAILTEEEKQQFQPVPALLKKGHASFHHPLMVHGSYGNHTALPRRSAVLNYFAEGTCSNTDESLLLGIPVVPRGQPIQGRFFPIVFDPKWL